MESSALAYRDAFLADKLAERAKTLRRVGGMPLSAGGGSLALARHRRPVGSTAPALRCALECTASHSGAAFRGCVLGLFSPQNCELVAINKTVIWRPPRRVVPGCEKRTNSMSMLDLALA